MKRDRKDSRPSDAADGVIRTDPLDLSRGAPVLLPVSALVWSVVEGPQKGLTFRSDSDQITIGGAPDNTIVLTDSAVSRHHAEVVPVPEGFLVRDLGSRNGTFLDGTRVREAFLAPGSRISFGKSTLRCEAVREAQLVQPSDAFGDLTGQSLSMRQLFGILERLAASDVSVVLWGETGTGKELAARALHQSSRRKEGPFSVLDCSAVDRELISSEILGHEVGAFTGATTRRAGAIEQADRGSLFIDEVGELPLELQPKLLRALERREVKRLGGDRALRIDCRVIAATHRDLAAMVRAGQFREDLYYRLAQVVVKLPPLRDRSEDIPLLVERFLDELQKRDGRRRRFAPEALRLLSGWALAGNVRELRNVVERACAMATGPEVQPADLAAVVSPQATETAAPATGLGPLEEAERVAIVAALETYQYHRGRVAASLGISAPTLRDRMRRYGIRPPGAPPRR